MRTAQAASQDHLSQAQAASTTSDKARSYQSSLISAELIEWLVGLSPERRPIHSVVKTNYKVNSQMASEQLFTDQKPLHANVNILNSLSRSVGPTAAATAGSIARPPANPPGAEGWEQAWGGNRE